MSRTARIVLLVVVMIVLGTGAALALFQPWKSPPSSEPHPPASQSPTASHSDSSPPESPRPPNSVGASLDANPAHRKTALEAARIMTTWNPAEDITRTHAELRAKHLMTAELAARITPPQRPAAGADWIQAGQTGATSSPSVQINDATEGPGVSILATWEWITADGTVLPSTEENQRIYFFHFNEDGQIDDYTY